MSVSFMRLEKGIRLWEDGAVMEVCGILLEGQKPTVQRARPFICARFAPSGVQVNNQDVDIA